jgi:putative flippase GtrA
MTQKKEILTQFIMFAGVGAIGTLAHYSVLICFVQYLGIIPVAASTIGFIVGAIVNYFLNYRWTFKSQKKHFPTISKFILIAFLGMLLNGLIMMISIELLFLHYLISQILATGIVLLWNFIGNRLWTFSEEII